MFFTEYISSKVRKVENQKYFIEFITTINNFIDPKNELDENKIISMANELHDIVQQAIENNQTINDPITMYTVQQQISTQELIKYYTYMNIDLPVHLFNASNKGHVEAIFLLSIYYKSIDDNINMIKCLKWGSEKNHTESIFLLGLYYKIIDDSATMLHYLMRAADNGFTDALMLIAEYYKSVNDDDNMIKYLLPVYRNKDTDAMLMFGDYYKTKNDTQNMLKYYVIAANSNNLNAAIELADYYERTCDYHQFIKYAKIIYHRGNKPYAYFLGNAYEKLKMYNDMIKYYEIAVRDCNECNAIERLIYHYVQPTTYNETELIRYLEMAVNKFDKIEYTALLAKLNQNKTKNNNITMTHKNGYVDNYCSFCVLQ